MKNFIMKKPFFFSVSCLSILGFTLRFILLGTNVDPISGFYQNDFGIWRILFIAVMLITFAFGFFWLRNVKLKALIPINMSFDFAPLFKERIFFAIVTVGFAVNTFYEIYRISNPLKTLLLPQNSSLFAAIAAVLSAASLMFFIVVSFLIDNQKIGSSAFSIVMVAWTIFRILKDFISFTTVFYISKNLLDIVYLCLLLITLFSLSRILAKADTAKGYKYFTILAPVTISLGFVLSIPAILGFVCGFDAVSTSDAFMHFVDMTLSIFLLRVSMHLYKEA